MFTWFSSRPLKSRQGYLCRTNHRWAMVTSAAGQSAGQTSLAGHNNCDPVLSDWREVHTPSARMSTAASNLVFKSKVALVFPSPSCKVTQNLSR